MIRPPAPSPCGSCPYRRDVPSGVWAREEYDKLPRYDGATQDQDPCMFMCHQQDGRACAGWVACHDMEESLGLRLACAMGLIDEPEAFVEYVTEVPLFTSGAEAREHGLAEVEIPGDRARRVISKLRQQKGRRGL